MLVYIITIIALLAISTYSAGLHYRYYRSIIARHQALALPVDNRLGHGRRLFFWSPPFFFGRRLFSRADGECPRGHSESRGAVFGKKVLGADTGVGIHLPATRCRPSALAVGLLRDVHELKKV